MSGDTPRNYPLQWPQHRPRKTVRTPGKFRHGRSPISVAAAMDRLEDELHRLGGKHLVVSTNIEPTLSGRPRSSQGEPRDPGVCAYFALKGKPFALACDTYTTVAQNIAALAAHVEATRAQERYGVASAEESLNAFSALPPPSHGSVPIVRPWREVLELKADFPTGLHAEDAAAIIKSRFRRLAGSAHPDKDGGSDAAMSELNAARDAALAAIKEACA